MSRLLRRSIAMTCLLLVTAGACGGDDAPSGTPVGGSGEVTVVGAWARTSPMAVSNGAVYADITSASDDAVVGVSVDATVAGAAALHETVAGATGAMMMHPIDELALPAGRVVSLAPGGVHIMLTDLVAPLEPGRSIAVVLTMKNGATVRFDAVVGDAAP